MSTRPSQPDPQSTRQSTLTVNIDYTCTTWGWAMFKLRGIALIAVLILNGGVAFAQDLDRKTANAIMPGCRRVVTDSAADYSGGVCLGIIRAMVYFGKDRLG